MTTTPVVTLADFLLARIAEDEQSLSAARLEYDDMAEWWMPDQWTRTRGLAECEAKRRIVDEFTSAAEWADRPDCSQPVHYRHRAGAMLDVLRLLALPFAAHPDYREEWKP